MRPVPIRPARAARGVLAALVVAGSWGWPIAAPHPVVRPYDAPATPYSSGHRGIDVAAAVGQQVMAPDDGVVRFAGVVVDRPVLSIEHADGVLSSFEPIATDLAAGDAVRRGQVIGRVAGGPHCRGGPCLHVGARIDGGYLSPLLFLGGVPRAILYPARGSPRRRRTTVRGPEVRDPTAPPPRLRHGDLRLGRGQARG